MSLKKHTAEFKARVARFHQALDYLTPDQFYFGFIDKIRKRA